MTIDAAIPNMDLSGYNTEDTYLATRFIQGGRTTFSIDLSLEQLANTVTRPDPDQPTEGNRKIVIRHAFGFATYLKTRNDSIIPPLLLRAHDGVFKFNSLESRGGTDWGTLEVPRLARNDVQIVDGQHRILGVHLLIQELSDELAVAWSNRAAALKEDSPSIVAAAEEQITQIEAQRLRLSQERVSVQVVIIDDAKEYKQIFVDIAENAKGITQAVKSRFDSTKVVNRCLEDVMEHPLIAGRVDLEADRVQGDNPNLLGAKHVADIIRTLQVGIGGRISSHQESILVEQYLVSKAESFLTILFRSFKDLDEVRQGKLTPEELRKKSLLGSVTMLRVLAGVYHELAGPANNGAAAADLKKLATQFFHKLENIMELPVAEESPWLKSKALRVGASAPRAAMGDLRNLTTVILAWAKSEPTWLRNG